MVFFENKETMAEDLALIIFFVQFWFPDLGFEVIKSIFGIAFESAFASKAHHFGVWL